MEEFGQIYLSTPPEKFFQPPVERFTLRYRRRRSRGSVKARHRSTTAIVVLGTALPALNSSHACNFHPHTTPGITQTPKSHKTQTLKFGKPKLTPNSQPGFHPHNKFHPICIRANAQFLAPTASNSSQQKKMKLKKKIKTTHEIKNQKAETNKIKNKPHEHLWGKNKSHNRHNPPAENPN